MCKNCYICEREKCFKETNMTSLGIKPLDKRLFVEIIESMMEQYYFDKKCSVMLSEVFGNGELGLYDNSRYLSSLMKLLRLHFPVDEDGFCEIEHYCFVLDFGKCGDEYEGIEELYDRLVKK